jgi:hypothetical protein
MKSAQRRKIFPHLNESKSSTAAADNANDESYDNAKSKNNKMKQQHPSSKSKSSSSTNSSGANSTSSTTSSGAHLLPLPLVLTVLLCSGLFWISSFRDVMATGKPILDTLGILWGEEDGDANLLVS